MIVTKSMELATLRTKIRMVEVQLRYKRLSPEEIERATRDLVRLQEAYLEMYHS